MCYITRQRRRRCWRSFPRQSTSAKQFFCRVNIVCIVRDALGTSFREIDATNGWRRGPSMQQRGVATDVA